ncbi:MAG: hypothetical protein OXB93_05535, partial [Cytophagales bacterium]|nr:hypothetical protein [Cytophagales bacterium]
MRNLYITILGLVLAVLLPPPLNAQQTAQEYLDGFIITTDGHNVDVSGPEIPSGKSLRVIFSKGTRLSGNDQVADGVSSFSHAIGLGLFTPSGSSASSSFTTLFGHIEPQGFVNQGSPNLVSGTGFLNGDLDPDPGDVYYVYLTLYDSPDGSGAGTTRELQITVSTDTATTKPPRPKFYVHRLAPPQDGIPNVEFISHSDVDESTRVFFFIEGFADGDFTAVADAADPNSGLFPAPDVIYDGTGGARAFAELPAGNHYFHATNRKGDAYNTQAIPFVVPESGPADGELQKLKPQFAISETAPTTLRLLRKGPVFA